MPQEILKVNVQDLKNTLKGKSYNTWKVVELSELVPSQNKGGAHPTTKNEKGFDEKLRNSHVIGKFGIGLKDAFATLERKGAKVFVKSKHGEITLTKSQKHYFEDIITLHASISSPSDPKFVGTEFVLDGVSDEDSARAIH